MPLYRASSVGLEKKHRRLLVECEERVSRLQKDG